jgi:hypothetical protein
MYFLYFIPTNITHRQGEYQMSIPDVPPGLATNAENWHNALKANLLTSMNTYRNANARAWQGLKPSAIPADGAQPTFDLTVKPSDRPHSWTDLGVTMPANPVVVPQVDEYVGPGFEGYTLTTYITVSGNEWIVLRDDYRWTMTTPESSPGAGDAVWEYMTLCKYLMR